MNMALEDVNVHDMQSVRLTLSEDPTVDRRSSHIWRRQELRCRHWPAHGRHQPYPLLCFHVIGALSFRAVEQVIG